MPPTTELPARRFLRDLFAGPFPGHGIVMDPELPPAPWPGDVSCSDRPVKDWVPAGLDRYERMCRYAEALGDDSVPRVFVSTGTQVFAAAFGCPVHIPVDSPPFARPLVETAEEADRLPQPGLDAEPLARIFEYAELIRSRLGPDVPINVPDLQSPFDIAALVWRKEALYLAMYEHPAAVQRLVAKCHALLQAFLAEFRRRVGECAFCHCPNVWTPPDLGCALSEDEAGSMSTAMFEQFCLPSLTELSRAWNGLFMHCCAAADHQYGNFRHIPNLRGLNRVFQAPGFQPAIDTFSGHTVLMVAWTDVETIGRMLAGAREDTRFLFNMGPQPLEEARVTFERLRKLCGR